MNAERDYAAAIEELARGPVGIPVTAAPSLRAEARAELLSNTLAKFRRWLHLPDPAPVYAGLGAIAANYLPGDPVWLGIVAPPSSAKTEILNATAGLPNVHQCATVTPAGLLSGSAKKDRVKAATGGLLRQIGDFGIIVLKDFGSVLSVRPDAKAEVLAALREVYDGSWTRHLGTDGGQSLSWRGKVGLLFGVTPVLDSHHAVMGAMGERFILCRVDAADEEQATAALEHTGERAGQMRRDLSDAVLSLFGSRAMVTEPLTPDEKHELVRLATLATRIRSTVERDRQSREIELVHGAEGPARLVQALERLLVGVETLGADRGLAFRVVRRVALDSVPVLRKRVLCWMAEAAAGSEHETSSVAEALSLPTNTVRRVLEDLAAYRLVSRRSGGKGHADSWLLSGWVRERLPTQDLMDMSHPTEGVSPQNRTSDTALNRYRKTERDIADTVDDLEAERVAIELENVA